MPFPQPAIPASFTVGNPAAGHETFDAAGVRFYGPDGVTVLFSFDTATGNIVASQGNYTAGVAPNAHAVLGFDSPATTPPVGDAFLSLYSGDARETAPGGIVTIGAGRGGAVTTQFVGPVINGVQAQLELNSDGTTAEAITTAHDLYLNIDGGQLAAMPLGTLTSTSVAAAVGTTAGEVLSGLTSGSFTLRHQTHVAVTCMVALASTVAGDRLVYSLRDGGNGAPTLASPAVAPFGILKVCPGAAQSDYAAVVWDFDLAAGTHNLGFTFGRNAGTGTVQFCPSNLRSSMRVDDAGTIV